MKNKKVFIAAWAVVLAFTGLPLAEAVSPASISPRAYTEQDLSSNGSQAVKLMESNQFQAAYDLLLPMYGQFASDSNLNFLLAQCSVNLKKPEDAIGYYQKILAKNASLPRVRLELGRAYAMIGQTEKAKKEFNAVLASSPPPIVADNVRKFMALLDTQKRFNIRASLGYVYDSNVNAGPDDIITHGQWTMDMRKKTDSGLSASLNLDILNPYAANGTWQSDFSYRNTSYFRLHDSSWQDFVVNTGPVFHNETQTFSLPLTIKSTYIGQQEYNRAYGVSPQWQIQLASNQQLIFSGSLLKQQYLTNPDRTGSSWSFSAADRFLLGPKNQGDYIEAGASYSRDFARADVFNDRGWSAHLSYYHRFDKSFWMMLQNTYTRTTYRGVDTYAAWVLQQTDGRAERQNGWQAMCGITAGPWNYMLTYSLSCNRSNIDIYSYNRTLINLQVTRNF